MGASSQVIGTGRYLPSRLVKNSELETMLNTSDEWIQKRCGIQSRYWADKTQSTSDLALEASLNAIENAKIDKNEIDMIILATVTPDHEFPGTACFLQEKLGLKDIPSIDVRQQCSGFIYSLSMADQYIKTGACKTILVVCSELHSKCLDLTPGGRNVSILFGDGAAAMVLQSNQDSEDQERKVLSTSIHSDGSFAKLLWCPAPGVGLPCSQRVEVGMIDEGLQFPHMNGKAIFVHAVRTMANVIKDCAVKNHLSVHDFELIFLHQANLRICEAVEKQLKLKSGVLYNTIQEYGNTTAATIPLSMAHAAESGALKPGMLVAAGAFGSGFTWGSALMKW